MIYYTFREWVSEEYGPFSTTDALRDFMHERIDELQEAYAEWCRQDDEAHIREIEAY